MDAKTVNATNNAADSNERDLAGLENMFKEVVINSGVAYVTVDGQAKRSRRKSWMFSAPRKTFVPTLKSRQRI